MFYSLGVGNAELLVGSLFTEAEVKKHISVLKLITLVQTCAASPSPGSRNGQMHGSHRYNKP